MNEYDYKTVPQLEDELFALIKKTKDSDLKTICDIQAHIIRAILNELSQIHGEIDAVGQTHADDFDQLRDLHTSNRKRIKALETKQ